MTHEGKQSADNPKSAPPRLTTNTVADGQAFSKSTGQQAYSKSASSSLPLDKYDKNKMALPAGGTSEDDIAYQSTLLHMRVVGRCHL